MSKILSATCVDNQVKIEDLEVDATILSQGKKASTGVALVERDSITYFASNAEDIKDLISSLETIIAQVVTIATALDAVTVSPGTAAAAITALTTLKTQLGLTKDNLK